MSLSPFSDAFQNNQPDSGVRDAIDRHSELIVHAVTDVTTRDLSAVRRIRWVDDDREYFYRYDATNTDTHAPPNVLVDNANNRFVLVSKGWLAVAVSGGEAALDMNKNDGFKITANADCEIQVPENALEREPFIIWVVVSGSGHTIDVATGFQGNAPTIQSGDGQQTVLSGVMLTSTTAIINDVKHF